MICSLSSQCAYFRLHIGNTSVGTSYFAVRGPQSSLLYRWQLSCVCLCLGPGSVSCFSAWFLGLVCGSRYALLAWGSAFRLLAVCYLFVICHLALYRLGHFLLILFVQYSGPSLPAESATRAKKKSSFGTGSLFGRPPETGGEDLR